MYTHVSELQELSYVKYELHEPNIDLSKCSVQTIKHFITLENVRAVKRPFIPMLTWLLFFSVRMFCESNQFNDKPLTKRLVELCLLFHGLYSPHVFTLLCRLWFVWHWLLSVLNKTRYVLPQSYWKHTQHTLQNTGKFNKLDHLACRPVHYLIRQPTFGSNVSL